MSIPPPVAIQSHSWGGLSDSLRQEFELILGGNGEQQPQGPNVDPLPAQNTFVDDLYWVNSPDGSPERVGEKARKDQSPWENKEQSVAEIKSLAERLQKYCVGGAKTRIVREELHKLGIVELTYRMKKRGGWRRKRKAKA